MTESDLLNNLAKDYTALRQTLADQAVDHKLLAEEVRQLREQIETIRPQTLGQAATPGATYQP